MQLVSEAIAVFFITLFSSNINAGPIYSALSIFACYFFVYSYNKNTIGNLSISLTLFITK